MDKQEVEKLAMQMFSNIYDMIRVHCPEVNHVSMFSIDGSVDITACRYGHEGTVQLFTAHRCADGTISYDYGPFEKEEAV